MSSRVFHLLAPVRRVGAALVALVCVSAAAQVGAKTLEPLWQLGDLPVPESVLYMQDSKAPYLFVSLIDGVPTEADGKGGIATLTPEGEILNKEWLTGLNAPKGMGTDGKLLYVADITELVVIDIKKARVIKKVAVPEAVFLNDVSVNSQGAVFVSDTRTHRVYRYYEGNLELYLENVDNANGLYSIGSSLVVGSATRLLLFGADKQEQVLATGFGENIDGVGMTERGEFIVTCWKGLIYYVYADGSLKLLLDSRDQEINTADIGYDHEHRRLFVPNFFKNTVTTYHVNDLPRE